MTYEDVNILSGVMGNLAEIQEKMDNLAKDGSANSAALGILSAKIGGLFPDLETVASHVTESYMESNPKIAALCVAKSANCE